jgi:hypothetical protein
MAAERVTLQPGHLRQLGHVKWNGRAREQPEKAAVHRSVEALELRRDEM